MDDKKKKRGGGVYDDDEDKGEEREKLHYGDGLKQQRKVLRMMDTTKVDRKEFGVQHLRVDVSTLVTRTMCDTEES